MLAALLAAGVALGAESVSDLPLASRLRAAKYGPLEDANAGRLYPLSAELLRAGRHMPEQLALKGRSVPPPPAEAAAADAQRTDLPPVMPGLQGAAADDWASVVSGPVVEDEKLAYTCFLGGDYATASAIYEKLHQREPDNGHFMLMSFLSLRNTGETTRSSELLSDLESKEETPGWAGWMDTMLRLGQTESEVTE